MATTFPAVATAATLVGGSSGAFGNLTSINPSGAARESLETTIMGTTTDKTFMPSDLQDPGEIGFEGLYDGSDLHADLGAAVETWTLTFRTGGTPTLFVVDGFLTAFDCSGELEGIWTYSGTIKCTGGIAIA